MISVAIIGSGNVGFHLYHRMRQCKDLKVTMVNARNPNSLASYDIAIVAVVDDAIGQVSRQLQTPLVVHTSGTTAMNALENTTRKGVFYPLQSFSKDKEVDFQKVPFCLEAEQASDSRLLEKLVRCLHSKYYHISSVQRNYLHIAAVFANNFTNHMYQMADDICGQQGLPFEILLPLIAETASKIQSISPKQAQTGPATRNDQKTIENHLTLLKDTQREMYQRLTESIQNHGKKL